MLAAREVVRPPSSTARVAGRRPSARRVGARVRWPPGAAGSAACSVGARRATAAARRRPGRPGGCGRSGKARGVVGVRGGLLGVSPPTAIRRPRPARSPGAAGDEDRGARRRADRPGSPQLVALGVVEGRGGRAGSGMLWTTRSCPRSAASGRRAGRTTWRRARSIQRAKSAPNSCRPIAATTPSRPKVATPGSKEWKKTSRAGRRRRCRATSGRTPWPARSCRCRPARAAPPPAAGGSATSSCRTPRPGRRTRPTGARRIPGTVRRSVAVDGSGRAARPATAPPPGSGGGCRLGKRTSRRG